MGKALDSMIMAEFAALERWMDDVANLLARAGADARRDLDAIDRWSTAWFFVDLVPPMLRSTVVLFEPSEAVQSRRFSWLDADGWHGAGAPREPLRSFIEGNWAQFRRNASAGTRPMTIPPHHMCRQAVDDGEIWFTASSLTNIEPEAFVAFHDAPRATPADGTPRPSGPHIGSKEAGEGREDFALRRWLHVAGRAELPVAFGWDACCWIGVGLSRAAVFDEHVDGDVDLVLGRMRWDVTPAERDAYLARARAEASLLAPEENIQYFAAMKAATEGRLTWNEMEPLIGIEVKASWYDTTSARWKRTHGSSGAIQEILGNLTMLRDRGFDRVALLHLAATAPRVTDVQPWFQASRDLAEAEAVADETNAFPLPLDAGRLDGAAYLTATIGAVPGTTEEYAGVGGRLELRVTGGPCAPGPGAGWKRKLLARLAALGRPRFPPPVFVLECPECQSWFLSGWPDIPRHACSAPGP